jgi:hypothetical protein
VFFDNFWQKMTTYRETLPRPIMYWIGSARACGAFLMCADKKAELSAFYRQYIDFSEKK